jgi:hypothetical protein
MPIHNAITLTPDYCRASGQGAANRQMRKACRPRWNDDDWNVAAETTARLMVHGGFWPAAIYETQIGRPFPAQVAA